MRIYTSKTENIESEIEQGVSFYRNQVQGSEDLGVKISRGKLISTKFGSIFER